MDLGRSSQESRGAAGFQKTTMDRAASALLEEGGRTASRATHLDFEPPGRASSLVFLKHPEQPKQGAIPAISA